jgi:hypothetical protein
MPVQLFPSPILLSSPPGSQPVSHAWPVCSWPPLYRPALGRLMQLQGYASLPGPVHPTRRPKPSFYPTQSCEGDHTYSMVHLARPTVWRNTYQSAAQPGPPCNKVQVNAAPGLVRYAMTWTFFLSLSPLRVLKT